LRSDEETFLERIEIQNSKPIFEMFYGQIKKSLPPSLVELVVFV
jgi:hypothetical protein